VSPGDAQPELRIKDSWPIARVFVRVVAPMPTAASLASFEEQYGSIETDTTYTLRLVRAACPC
jgi:hypothetical protein